jgi:uncharacterized protein (TIGR03083 family)
MLRTVDTAAVDLAAVSAALARVARDVAALVRSAPDAGAPVPGSDWTVGDVAAHLVLGAEAYAGYATGATEAAFDVTDIAGGSLTRSSAALLEAEPERDLPGLADRMEAAVTAVLQASQGRGADDIVMWNGQPIGLAAMLGIGLAEFLLHGRDLATALSQPWPIEAGDARLVLASAFPLLPLLVDPVTTAHAHATYDLRVRGGAQVVLAIEDGRLRVGAPGPPVDCHVSADPVALLLVAYGRTSQWIPILTGKLVAWGRKPWLGPKLVRYLVAP